MSTPNVTISKNVFTTGQAPASTTGILAIVACASGGTDAVNTPGGFARTDLAVTAHGYGPLTDFGAYDIDVANQPVLLERGAAGFAGAYGTITKSFASGTTTCVANASAPYDGYDVEVNFLTAGIIGVTGITYTTSQDGGESVSGALALGVATTLSIANTGVAFDLTGPISAGDSFQCYTTRPMLGNTEVTAALTALGTTRLPYEGVLIDCSAGSSTVGLIDTILSGWEARGVFKFFLINSRFKTEPAATGETESAYAASLSGLFGTQTSVRGCVGADGARVASPITGWSLKRPTSLLLAARAMGIPIGEDPAYIARGALVNAQIADSNGNPQDHDEDLYPNLDALRLTSLRSFAPGGPQGVYFCNANSIQPSGGAYPYLQHIRIMNRACEIAWFTLTTQLSRGVRKNPKKDPVSGAVTIFEPDAALIESIVNEALTQPLKGQVSSANFSISRTDDLNAVPCIVTGVLSIVALAYIKGFVIQSQFSKTLTTAL